MGKRVARAFLAFMLLALFLTYLGYQMINNLGDRIRTVDVSLVTVADTITANGVFIRSQRELADQSQSLGQYLVDEGEKVSKDSEIAIFFRSNEEFETYREIRTLEKKIASLKYARVSLLGTGDSLKVDRLVFEGITDVLSKLDQGDLRGAEQDYSDICQLAVSRGVSFEEERFEAQIEVLEREITGLTAQIGGGQTTVKTPVSGYFSYSVDGYEQIFEPQRLAGLTIEQIRNSLPDRQILQSGAIGSIVDGFEWYFAVPIDVLSASALKGMSRVTVSFPDISPRQLDVELYEVRIPAEGEALVIFKSGVMTGEYLSRRFEKIEIVLKSYTGIKIPREALRQDEESRWGVYCLDGSIVTFKPIEWIYQTESYYLAKPAESSRKGIYLFDRIVLNAKALSNDKVIN